MPWYFADVRRPRHARVRRAHRREARSASGRSIRRASACGPTCAAAAPVSSSATACSTSATSCRAGDAPASPRSRRFTRSAGRCARTRGCRRSRSTAATTGTGRTARTAPRPCSPMREHIVELSPAGANRPFAVIDDGWQPGRGQPRRASARGIAATRSFRTCPASPARFDGPARGPASGFVRCRRRPTRRTLAAAARSQRSSIRRCPKFAEGRRRHRAPARSGATS